MIKQATVDDLDAWAALRIKLWPDCSSEASRSEALEILESKREACFLFVADEDQNAVVGFVEISTRDYVDGCSSSPVGYVEGVFVEERYRKRGIGKLLIERGYEWMLGKGCSEVGSDASLDNNESIAFHERIGFEEVERQVVFMKKLRFEKPGGTTGVSNSAS